MILDDLKALIDGSGLVTDYDQAHFFDESKYTNKTIAYSINGGSGSDHFVRNPTVDFVFYGIESSKGADRIDVANASESIFNYFLDNYSQGCIIGIIPLVEVAGPNYSDSGRPMYTFTIQLKTAR
ncbi:hypothetical protein CL622_04540 [archaeon]|nr:hypothetical protein [archaeon]|tara:strand:- start:352 stop:726 length:375 start_codon:yes stop_codon:yes gene_type:complete